MMDEKRVRDIIHEATKRILNEKLGVNDDVVGMTKSMTSSLTSFVNKTNEWRIVDVGGVKTKMIVFNCTAKFDENTVQVRINMYRVNDKNHLASLFDKIDVGGYIEGDKEIVINAFMVGNDILYGWLKSTLSHELQHFLENTKKGTPLGNISYNKAVMIIDGRDKMHQGYLFKNVAEAIYYFSKFEINAEMHGLYEELMTISRNDGIKGNDLMYHWKETNFYLSYSHMIDVVDTLKLNETNAEMQTCMEYFNMDIKKLLTHCEKAINYIRKKIGKVIQNACDYSSIPIDERKIPNFNRPMILR